MSTAATSRSAKKAPAVHVTLAMFDSREPIYRVRRESVPIAGFSPLGPADYTPSAMTPLRDAVAQFIAHLEGIRESERVTIGLLLDESGSMASNREAVIAGVNEFVGGMREVDAVDPASAGKVLAVIVTDGLENSSREVDPPALASLIAERERDGWTFIYLGANQDAWAVGHQAGFSGGVTGQAVNFRATPTGTRAAMASVGDDARRYLRDVESYAQARADSSRRSITEDGDEVAANLGAQAGSTNNPSSPPAGDSRYSNVRKALEQAKEATQR